MSKNQQTAIFELIARIGLEAAAMIMEAVNKPDATIDDAIAACRAAESKTLGDFKKEA